MSLMYGNGICCQGSAAVASICRIIFLSLGRASTEKRALSRMSSALESNFRGKKTAAFASDARNLRRAEIWQAPPPFYAYRL